MQSVGMMPSKHMSSITDGRSDDPHGVGVPYMVSEMLTVGETRELLFMGTADCSAVTHTENIKDFEWCVVSRCTMQMLSKLVVVTCLMPQNLTHADLWQFTAGIISLVADYRMGCIYIATVIGWC